MGASVKGQSMAARPWVLVDLFEAQIQCTAKVKIYNGSWCVKVERPLVGGAILKTTNGSWWIVRPSALCG